jgi:hypothetical protein
MDYIESSLPTIEIEAQNIGPLDYDITLQELKSTLRSVKNGKSTGPDKISNEMIINGGDNLHNAVVHMFNIIIKHGKYPSQWKKSIITPIHKSSDINDPNNYRGIAIADCLSKIFCKVINSRIVQYLEEKGFWKPNQSGFREKRRTEDNIFILHTLFQKYVSVKKSKLYVAFVDFRKFFDCINRNALYYKLLKCGITGNIYSVLKSAYTDSTYSVRTTEGITNSFSSTTGVKQGCNLSPTLSNLYQNDIHDIFDESCDPVNLDDFIFNSLSWADDLVIIST